MTQRIWFDTEFIDDGERIHLISIGAVREDGREFYAELAHAPLHLADAWVEEHVLSKLTGDTMARDALHWHLLEFAGQQPEFWAYYAAYDWVALCQLFGPRMLLPSHWPRFCMDVKQLAVHLGNPPLPKQETPDHHALNDAVWTRHAWQYLSLLGSHPYWRL